MKLSMFLEQLRNNPDFEDEHIKSVLISDLNIVEDGGQVRAGGISPSHISELADDISARGLECPITIDTNNIVIEGNHRVKAFRSLAKMYPKAYRWKRIKAYKRDFANDAEKRAYQLKCNSHPPAKASTADDYALVVAEDLKSGMIPEMDWDSFNDRSENFGILVEYIKENYGAYGITGNTAKSVAKKTVTSAPNSKLQNYTKKEIVSNFRAKNDIGWSGKSSGDDSNGYSVYAIGSDSHIFPNLTGNTYNKKTANGNQLSTVAVVWESNTYGKDGKKIDEYRSAVVNKINEANGSWLLNKGSTLVDEVYLVPQKLRGSKESTDKFFRVSKDSNGKFDVSSIPTKGWK
tara:strand:+ start:116 stop:1159 length:1044 start_codon:yes stop_codon:yes gene_type:complete